MSLSEAALTLGGLFVGWLGCTIAIVEMTRRRDRSSSRS